LQRLWRLRTADGNVYARGRLEALRLVIEGLTETSLNSQEESKLRGWLERQVQPRRAGQELIRSLYSVVTPDGFPPPEEIVWFPPTEQYVHRKMRTLPPRTQALRLLRKVGLGRAIQGRPTIAPDWRAKFGWLALGVSDLVKSLGQNSEARRTFLVEWLVENGHEGPTAEGRLARASRKPGIVRACIRGHHQVVSHLVLKDFLKVYFSGYRPSTKTIDRMRVKAESSPDSRGIHRGYYELAAELLATELIAAI
jgi:hypothetical protein